MSEIKKGAEALTIECAKCGHTQLFHTKITVRDQSRISLSKPYPSECRKCTKEDKICKNFKPKTKDKHKGFFQNKSKKEVKK